MVYAREAVGTTGDEEAPAHTCSFGSWYRAKDPTCTSSGYDRRDCSCGEYETSSVSALGHTGGSLSDGNNASQHWRYCTRCWEAYDHQSHGYGKYSSMGDSQHHRFCKTCGYEDIENHDAEAYEQIPGDNDLHERRCSDCNEFRFWEAHLYNGEPHVCGDCGYANTVHIYCMYNETNGGDLDESLSYECQLEDGAGCTNSVSISAPDALKGMSIEYYAASDATTSIGNVPPFPNGTYDFEFDGILRDMEGNEITSLNMPENYVKLFGWTQRNVMTHTSLKIYKTKSEAKRATDLLEASFYSYEEYVEQNGPTSMDVFEDQAYASKYLVIEYTNDIEDKQVKDWPSDMKGTAADVIDNGNTYDPTVEFIAGGAQKFTVEYDVGSGGWMFKGSPFFENDQLYGGGGSGGGGRRIRNLRSRRT